MKKKSVSHSMGAFYALWATQSLSSLGSAMTGYALIVWSYTQEGSALKTALLTICSYAPYVVLSLFAGALSDRWDKKRTMSNHQQKIIFSFTCMIDSCLQSEMPPRSQTSPWRHDSCNTILQHCSISYRLIQIFC